MKQFHISDVLSVTTPYLLSSRHIEGVYDILNFLTGDSLFTCQLPRAQQEVSPWLGTQFPLLMGDSPEMAKMCTEFARHIEMIPNERRREYCETFVEQVRQRFALPEMLAVYEMPREQHTHIDPVEELKAMVGDDKVITF